MERESFENEVIAAILNENFVSIKVDREQRPDLDNIYMSFTQAMTSGVCLPQFSLPHAGGDCGRAGAGVGRPEQVKHRTTPANSCLRVFVPELVSS